MKAHNIQILKKGYAPAQSVANATGKHLTTIHRWADTGVLESVRDGRVLYVKLASCAAYFRRAGLDMIAVNVDRLAKEVAKDVAKSEAACG